MVRLKEPPTHSRARARKNFNSTMVRLKGLLSEEAYQLALKFQFHYGSVKRIATVTPVSIVADFNSTMVRLKEIARAGDDEAKKHFNSTMVRLKVRAFFSARNAPTNFNSTMVRLKDLRDGSGQSRRSISIPLWFG